MERIVTSEISKFLIIIGLAAAGLAGWMGKIVNAVSGGAQFFQRATLVYLFVGLGSFCLVVITERLISFNEPSDALIFFQVLCFVAGTANVFCMQKYLPWGRAADSLRAGLPFTILLCLIGGIGFWLLYRLFHHDGMEYIMLSGILFVCIPFLVYHSFRQVLAIPQKLIKQWHYPLHEEMQEPDEKQLKNLLVISFEFQKQTGSSHYTNFRAKAPIDMPFGQLFYFFINDYNERHPNDLIEIADQKGNPVPWIFNKKPAWYTLSTRYHDHERSVYLNHIRENDVIICTRMEAAPELSFSTLK